MRSWFLLFLVLIVSTDFATASVSEKLFLTKKSELTFLINRGSLNAALLKCEKLLGSNLSKDQRYEILTTQSKIYFWTENFYEFNRIVKSAYEIKKKKSAIYKAYYYSQKAAFFHYHILADSAVYYSDKSIELLSENWQFRTKVPFHFIYQIYGTVFLYRNLNGKSYSNSEFDRNTRLPLILNYQDSALNNIDQVPHFKQEEAIIHRSKGNRIMDHVGYSVRNSKSDFNNYAFQISKANQAINEYRMALKVLDKNEHTLSNEIKSLIALAFYCTNREHEGDAILWPIIKKLKKDKIKDINSENIQLLNVLQTFSHSIISKNKFDSRIYSVIRIYKSLRDDWYWYLISKNKNYLDSYGESPTSMLSIIYIWLNNLEIENLNLNYNLRYSALDNYIYYSKTLDFLVNKNGLSLSKKEEIKASILTLLNLYKIQKKLSEKDAVMVQIFAAMKKEKYLLITKKALYVDTFKRQPLTHYTSLQIEGLTEFKRKGFQNFSSSPFSHIFKKSKISKLYVAIDINENFDVMIMDTLGDSFEELNYFKSKINVIKVYNPIDFFSIYPSTDLLIKENIAPFYTDINSKDRLPFSQSIFTNFNRKRIKPLRFINLNDNGIAHIIGHGNLKLEKDRQSYTNYLQSNQLKKDLIGNQRIKTDLFILNLCFGAYKRSMFYPDRDLQNQLISKGAKAVIASPYQTIDQSSAYIFEKFYHYLFKGETVEDALQLAKLDYLKTHTGIEAHPQYWSTYELTSNVKDLRIAPEPIPDKSWQAHLVLFVLIAIVLRFYLYWEDC
jgi:hypothetical protein